VQNPEAIAILHVEVNARSYEPYERIHSGLGSVDDAFESLVFRREHVERELANQILLRVEIVVDGGLTDAGDRCHLGHGEVLDSLVNE
jgi:hypothetical protein